MPICSALHELCKETVFSTIMVFLFNIVTPLADAYMGVLFHYYAAFLCGSKCLTSVVLGPGLNKNAQAYTRPFLSFTRGKKAHCKTLPTSRARFNENDYSDIMIFILF